MAKVVKALEPDHIAGPKPLSNHPKPVISKQKAEKSGRPIRNTKPPIKCPV